MKKIALFSVLFLLHTLINAQTQALDTLYANAHQVVSLSFASPIEKGISGSSKYTFSFNREAAEDLGLLQAQKAPESNLLVRTLDGSLYGFVLAYRENLAQLYHFISSDQRLKNPYQKSKLQETSPKASHPTPSKENYALRCQQLLYRKASFQQVKRQKGLRIRMTQSVYHGDKVYIGYEFKNRSAIPYELGQLQLYKVLGTRKRKASYQELPLHPYFTYQLPHVIGSRKTVYFVVVYPKFTLNAEERLQLKLLETNGSRNLTLKLR